MEHPHARLLCRLAFEARERGFEVWAGKASRAIMRHSGQPCPVLLSDAGLGRRCPGLPQQVGHVTMLWLRDSAVVCRIEFPSVPAPSFGFPGPQQVRCLAVATRPDQARIALRQGWAVVFSRDLQAYWEHSAPRAAAAAQAHETHARVAAVERCGEDAYRMTLRCEALARTSRAGQFVLLGCLSQGERRAFERAKNATRDDKPGFSVDPKLPLLRRPFGFHRFDGPDYAPERLCEQPPLPPQLMSAVQPARAEVFDIMFKVVGRGTQRLAQMHPPERLPIRGPLGRPVEVRSDLETAVLVAGGIGVGPLFALAQELRRQGRTVHAVLGARDRASAPVAPQEFEMIGASAALVTEKEDGLLVTQYLERHLGDMIAGISEIFACGPTAMLAQVASVVPAEIPVQVLLEQRMACGMGVCRGCVVSIRSPGGQPAYRTVCRDGPSFRADQVAWEELAATVGS